MLQDEKRVTFHNGVWWLEAKSIDSMQNCEAKNLRLTTLTERFVDLLVSNEQYFLRNCWDNVELCLYYRSYVELLYLSAESCGLVDLSNVIQDEIMGWLLWPHKDDMDDERCRYVNFSLTRDAMMASMQRLRKWLQKQRLQTCTR